MTNFEKYKDRILNIVRETNAYPAIKNGAPVRCKDILGCEGCDLKETSCRTGFFEWLYEDDGKQELTCSSCKYEDKREDEYPCSQCSRNYTDLFKLKPKKTRQDEFLEHYPNAKKCKDILKICPAEVDIDYKVCETYSECPDCRRDYWLQEVEE